MMIEAIRKKHIETGVLEENEDNYLNVNLDGIDAITASILTVYYEDTKIKLEYLNEISNQIKIFMEVMNKKLYPGKELQINQNNGISVIQKQQKRTIKLNTLSSGEQGLGYKFTNLDWKRLSHLYMSELESEALKEIMNKAQIPFGVRIEIQKQMIELKKLKYPVEYIRNGHDMLRLLSALTVNFISTQKVNRYDEECLTELLSLAYNIQSSELSQDNLENGMLDIVCDNSVNIALA